VKKKKKDKFGLSNELYFNHKGLSDNLTPTALLMRMQICITSRAV
jgi:hypothetical protein